MANLVRILAQNDVKQAKIQASDANIKEFDRILDRLEQSGAYDSRYYARMQALRQIEVEFSP